MGLLTHNTVSCNIKGVSNRYPMKLKVEKWVMKETKLNADFLHNIFSKIEWSVLVAAAEAFGCPDLWTGLLDPTMLGSDEFLQKFHHTLLELHVEEGAHAPLCTETDRRFPINKGILNMLLHVDEV